MREFEVSVICITYNQSRYIKKALDSILAQKTDFPFEVIVHDDASTDDTLYIARDYETRYKGQVHVISEQVNLYSQGVLFTYDIIRNVAKGRYIAFCEGDDFWVDEFKIQKQYDALEEHPECDMCACQGVTTSEDGIREIGLIRPAVYDSVLSMEDVILGGGLYLVTAGLFFRRGIIDNLYDFQKICGLDYVFQMRGAMRGGIFYIDRKMAAYRRYSEGSWTNRVLHNKEKLKEQWELEKEMLRKLDEDTDGKYHDTICRRLMDYTPFEEQLKSHEDEIVNELKGSHGKVYIWGYGRRGECLEGYLKDIGIKIDGICDAMNTKVGNRTCVGNLIVYTDDVMDKADTIIASNDFAYEDLQKSQFKGKLLNFHKYMPYG